MSPKIMEDVRYIDFVKRYRNNLHKFAKEVCLTNVTWQQLQALNYTVKFGSRVSISSGHGTGKTAIFSIIVLWHLLCYYNSITAIIAPKIDQVRKQVFKEVALALNRMKKGEYSWVAEHVELLATELYIKGAQQYWHVLAKTAPKGEPENLAGLHGDFLMIIVDEASGVEDSHFGVLTGALTDERNRMLLASQPTKPVGFFYDTHHKLAKNNGGSWTNLTFNSEESPLVSTNFIKEKKLQYTKEQYDIKVKGLFPDKANGFLLGSSEVYKSFNFNPLKDRKEPWGYVIPIDIGGGDYRDSSVMLVAKVSGFGLYGENARRVYIDEAPIISDRLDTVQFARAVKSKLANYNNPSLAVDYGGMGVSFIHILNDLGVGNIHKVIWGNPCFKNEYKEAFFNLRSQAIASMSRACVDGRLGFSKKVVDVYGTRILGELTRIPYDYDNKARIQITPKAVMRTQGISSPDIADSISFCFLEGVSFIACNDDFIKQDNDFNFSALDVDSKLDSFFN